MYIYKHLAMDWKQIFYVQLQATARDQVFQEGLVGKLEEVRPKLRIPSNATL